MEQYFLQHDRRKIATAIKKGKPKQLEKVLLETPLVKNGQKMTKYV